MDGILIKTVGSPISPIANSTNTKADKKPTMVAISIKPGLLPKVR
jgi:hypothetical protein